jgi:threonine dehydratase
VAAAGQRPGVDPVDRDDIAAAAGRIAGHVRRTPILRVAAAELGIVDGAGSPHAQPLVAKLDLLQPTGSFKVRGAASLLTAIDVPPAGVVAASGGNFGLAIAYAARRLGHRASVFVPDSSPPEKIEPLRALDAEVHVIPGYYAHALTAADEHVAVTGAVRAHAYDQREVVAGQGTAGREVLEDAPEVDTILVACGGGGLLAGVAGWAGDRVRVVAVETTGTATLAAALAAGRPVDVEVRGLAASALGARRIGDHAWAARHLVNEALVVTDEDVREAQHRLWETCRVVTEPGGATAMAALTARAYTPAPHEVVAVLVCGANTDPGSVVRPAPPSASPPTTP